MQLCFQCADKQSFILETTVVSRRKIERLIPFNGACHPELGEQMDHLQEQNVCN